MPAPSDLGPPPPAKDSLDSRPAEQPQLESTSSDSSCNNNTACLWYFNDFLGRKQVVHEHTADNGWQGFDGFSFASAKNRFGNRKIEVGNSLRITACLNPGGTRENIDVSDRFNLGRVSSRCGG